MVGRDRELAAVQAFLAGAPGALVLEGEAGIGKSTLWQAALDLAGRRVVAARPTPNEQGLSFTVLADLLEPLVDETAPALPDVQRRALEHVVVEGLAAPHVDARTVAAATRSALRAAAGPLVVAVDDVQWTDPASAAALGYALRRLGDARVHVLLARRIPEPLPFALESPTVDVRPLTLGELQELLVALPGTPPPRAAVAWIHATSGGNPLFAKELARAYAASGELVVPESLNALLYERIRPLRAATRRALARFALGGQDEQALAPAREAGILHGTGDGLAFAHPLLGEAAVAVVPPRERRRLHAELAEQARSPEERARHRALAADEPDEAVAAELEEAAEAAVRRGAAPNAIALLELAVAATPAAERAALVRRRLRRAELLVQSGDHRTPRDDLERLLVELPPGTLRARVWYLTALGPSHTLTVLEGARNALEETDDESHAMDYGLLFAWAHHYDDVATALDVGRGMLERAERTGDPELVCAALGTLAAIVELAGGDPTELVERGLATGSRRGLIRDYLSPQHVLIRLRLREGRFDEARELNDAFVRDLEERGDEYAIEIVSAERLAVDLHTGRWDAIRADVAQSVATQRGSGAPHFLASNARHRAFVWSYLGDAEAVREAAAAVIGSDVGAPGYVADVQVALGFVALAEGRAADAIPLLEESIRFNVGRGRLGPNVGTPNARGLLCEALLAVGDPARACEVADDLERRLTPIDAPARAVLRRCRALLPADGGDVDTALALLEQARPLGAFEEARNRLLAGSVLRRALRRREARAELEAARATFAELGAQLWLARADDELARLGGRAPSGAELTAAERRVADLVAAGLSNKEAAARLVVTVGTVEAHLSRIYAKLGVRSRTELAARRRQSVGESPIAGAAADS